MAVTNSLLVAMMFVVLLTMGIGNIVMSLATMIDQRTALRPDRIHTSWVVLLLLVYLNLFWHVLDILAVESWTFGAFLYFVGGALILFFATQVLLPEPMSADAGNLRAHYHAVSRQFFLLFAVLQIWTLGTDWVLGHGFVASANSTANAGGVGLGLILAATRHEKAHALGTVVGWGLFLAVGFLYRGDV